MASRRASAAAKAATAAFALALVALLAGPAQAQAPPPAADPTKVVGSVAPGAAPAAFGAGAFGQCGGSANCAGNAPCADGPWASFECPTGFGCARQSAFFYQCVFAKDVTALEARSAADGAAPRRRSGAAPLAEAEAAEAPLLAPLEEEGPVVVALEEPAPAVEAAPRAAPEEPVALAPAPLPVVAAPVVAAPAPPPPVPPTPVPAPAESLALIPARTNNTGPADVALVCACLDYGFGRPECTEGAAAYCSSSKADAAACASMRSFYATEALAPGAAAARFLLKACAIELPKNATLCDCAKDMASVECAAHSASSCAKGTDPLCPPLTLGSAASPRARNALAEAALADCPSDLASVPVSMTFAGVSPAEFERTMSRGTIAALGNVTGLPTGLVVPKKAGSGGGGGGVSRRSLRQAAGGGGTTAEYSLRPPGASSAKVVKAMQDAGKDGGAGMYNALAREGVDARPSFSVAGGPAMGEGLEGDVRDAGEAAASVAPAGSPAAAPAAAAKKKKGGLGGGAIAGIVIGCLVGAALLAVLLALLCRKHRAGAAGVKKAKAPKGAAAAAKGAGAAAVGTGAAAATAVAASKDGGIKAGDGGNVEKEAAHVAATAAAAKAPVATTTPVATPAAAATMPAAVTMPAAATTTATAATATAGAAEPAADPAPAAPPAPPRRRGITLGALGVGLRPDLAKKAEAADDADKV